jgi:acyl-coenzyme A synthetase/AMP-(fatty) acid ligase
VYKTGDLAHIGDDGMAYFHGRSDEQIKSRGYRIELGEIETALTKMEGLRESVVVAIPSDGFEGNAHLLRLRAGTRSCGELYRHPDGLEQAAPELHAPQLLEGVRPPPQECQWED